MFHQELTLAPQASQISMITSEILRKGTIYNHHTAAIEIKGTIDQATLLKSLHALANRHIILHAKLGENEGNPVLKIITDKDLRNKNINNNFKFIDASHLPYSHRYSPHLLDLYENLKIINEEAVIETPFNLDEGPLWRVALIMLDPNHYQLLFVFNHIIIDGRSVANLFKDFSVYYNAYLKNPNEKEDHILPYLPTITELDFSLDANIYQNRLDYWKDQLKDLKPIALQPDILSTTSFRFLGKRIRFNLPKSLLESVEANKSLTQGTLNQQLFAALFVLLHRYTDETDICIGIPSANRQSEKINPEVMDGLVNCFMNIVPIRLNFNKDCTFAELVANVHQTLRNGLENQLPINEIYEKALTIETKSNFKIASPFSILWSLNREKPQITLNDQLLTDYVDLDLGRTKVTNFALNLDLHKNGCDCFIEYNSDLFTESTMNRLVGHLKNIIEYTAKHPDCKISVIPFLLDEERRLIQTFNNTDHALPVTGCIHDIFTQLANKYPNQTAVVVHHQDQTRESMTYSELEARSTRLAFQLLKLNMAEGEPIGVCLKRSPELLVAMLGLMKARKVFVPLQKCKTAMKGLNHRIETAEVKLVITDDTTTPIFEKKADDLVPESRHQVHTFNINKLTELELTNVRDVILPTVSLTDPAHIMFTSGSSAETPQPKGVVNSHLGLTNLLGDLILEDKAPKEENIISTAPFDFDAFIYDFLKLLALLFHGKAAVLHYCDDASRISPSVLNRIIAELKNVFGVFLPRQLALLEPSPNVVSVISMGEKPLEATQLNWKAVNPNIKFRDGFGVTEASICLSTYPIKEGAVSGLIGKPIINMQMPILDENLRPCPIGVTGEIYVSGPGLALGYLKLPDLNKLKFIYFRFDEKECVYKACEANEGQRFYKTGDYGCYVLTEEGLVIQCKGRKDRQIKINGVQINTDVITAVMFKSELVKDIVLVPNEESSALIAFIVPKNSDIEFRALKKQIMKALKSTLLPRIAYPHTFIEMATLPYTQNGKVDLKQLPMPDTTTPIVLPEKESIDDKPKEPQPTTKMQLMLQELFSQILSKPKNKIRINKTFDDLGGDSPMLALFEIKINASKKKFGLREDKNFYIGMNILKLEMTIESLELDLKPYLNVKSSPNAILPFNGVFKNNNSIAFLFPLSPTTKREGQESPTPSHQTHDQPSLTKNKNY